MQVPPEQNDRFDRFLDSVGYGYHLEDENEMRGLFL